MIAPVARATAIGVGLMACLGSACDKSTGGPGPREPAASTPPPAASASPVLPDVRTLPRTDLDVTDRAAWRDVLHWPAACEESFAASHAGEDAGLTFVSLSPGVSLVEVVCVAGSYQPSMVRLRLDESFAGLRTTTLAFPVVVSEDDRTLTESQQTEVWGESLVTPARQEIAVLSIARQSGDCGVWARYSLADKTPRLLEVATRVPCPSRPGPPAQLSASDPPPGWTLTARKD